MSGARRRRVVISNFDSPGNPHYGGGGAAVMEIDRAAPLRRIRGDILRPRRTVGRSPGTPSSATGTCRSAGPGRAADSSSITRCFPSRLAESRTTSGSQGFTPPWSTSFLPLFSPARVVGIAHELSGMHMWRRYRLPFFLVERLGLRCYRDLVVLDLAEAEQVKRLCPAASVQVIPNGTAIPELGRQPFGGGEHILYLGRIDIWHKGLDVLISAYQRSNVRLPLVIAGKGTRADEGKLSALVDAAGGGVQWVGRVAGETKQDLLSRCAFLVMPSRAEAFGIAALEAMAWGKPVVHFSLPTLDWMDGDVTVDCYDTGALAEAICGLASRR